jgi:hypothetical protein
MGEVVKPGDELAYFRCYRCKGVLFTVPAHRYNHNMPVPKEVQQRMVVRKTWSLAHLEEEIFLEEEEEETTGGV